MRQMIENQPVSARLDNRQAVLDCDGIRLGGHFESASDFAPLYLGRRLRETATHRTTTCRHIMHAVRAALGGMQISMSPKPRLSWLAKQPVRLPGSVS